MPDTYIYHIEGFGVKILAELQELMESQTVGGGIAPVGIHVAGSAFNGANGTFPVVGVLWLVVTLHIATTREAHKGRMQGLQLLSQIYTASVLSALKGGREQAHYVQQNGTFPVEPQMEFGLRIGSLWDNGSLYLLPTFPFAFPFAF